MGGVVLGVAAFALGMAGKKKSRDDTWVECKELKTTVKRAHVQKLAASVDDVRAFREAKACAEPVRERRQD